jgi:hypothetical protein
MNTLQRIFGIIVMIIGAIPIAFFLVLAGEGLHPPNYFLWVGIIVFVAGGLLTQSTNPKK